MTSEALADQSLEEVRQMPYTVTVRRVDTDVALTTVTCADLPSALRVKSRAFRSYHFNDLGGLVVVPPTMDFDDWDDVDRLRYGNRGPYFPVHVSVDNAPGTGLNDRATMMPSAASLRG